MKCVSILGKCFYNTLCLWAVDSFDRCFPCIFILCHRLIVVRCMATANWITQKEEKKLLKQLKTKRQRNKVKQPWIGLQILYAIFIGNIQYISEGSGFFPAGFRGWCIEAYNRFEEPSFSLRLDSFHSFWIDLSSWIKFWFMWYHFCSLCSCDWMCTYYYSSVVIVFS